MSRPLPQHHLRGYRRPRPRPRAVNTAEHHARLARRLTPRDRWLAHMLHEHRVLTTGQIADLAFPSARSAGQRLLELFEWNVLDRFQPFVTVGTTPMHYVLGPAGATLVAAEADREPGELGYRRTRTLAIAHSLRLAHTVGVNGFFTALAAHARHHPAAELRAWWAEPRCHGYFGDLARPDGYGRWATADRELEFFLEFDCGTETLGTLASKLHDYARLATATGITTPVLIWLPTSRREVTARRVLHRTWSTLDNPQGVPVATAAADQLDTTDTAASPADAVWQPLEATEDPLRRTLHNLAQAWPHLPPVTAIKPHRGRTTPNSATTTRSGLLPAPPPMPPPPGTRR